jgi:hypothetical protein
MLSTRRCAAVILALAVPAAACYSHHPLTEPVPARDTRIVAEVTDVGRTSMANLIGVGAMRIDGVVVASDTGSWTLSLLRVDYRAGPSTAWNRETVNFPRHALTNAKERTLDRRKSWLAAGIITVTALLAARLFGAFGFGEAPGGDPEPPN